MSGIHMVVCLICVINVGANFVLIVYNARRRTGSYYIPPISAWKTISMQFFDVIVSVKEQEVRDLKHC